MGAQTVGRKAPVIFFDVVETVFSLAPLEEKFTDLNLPNGTAKLFFAQLLRDAFALSASGVFYSFPDIAKGTLNVLLDSTGRRCDERTLKSVLDVFSRLPPHKDVKPALERVKQAGARAVLLTNGSRANSEKLVQDNDLSHLVEDIVSVDDFKIWKPQTQLYHQAARKHSCDPDNALLIAAHAWDVHGSIRAGFKGIWVQRKESVYHPLMDEPAAQAENLVDAVEMALQRLPSALSRNAD